MPRPFRMAAVLGAAMVLLMADPRAQDGTVVDATALKARIEGALKARIEGALAAAPRNLERLLAPRQAGDRTRISRQA